MPRNVCWRCNLRLETRLRSPKLRSEQQVNESEALRGNQRCSLKLKSRSQVAKSTIPPQAFGIARLIKHDFQKPTHGPVRRIFGATNFDSEKMLKGLPRVSGRYQGRVRAFERRTGQRKDASPTTNWRLRFLQGTWKPVTEASSSASKFRDRVLGLIDSDVLAMKVINQQRSFEKALSLREGNVTGSKSATFGGGTILDRGRSIRLNRFTKRAFATHAHYRPETVNSTDSSSLPGFHQQDKRSSKVRQDLASWQLENSETDTRIKAFLGLPQVSLGTGMATKVDDSLSSADEGDSKEDSVYMNDNLEDLGSAETATDVDLQTGDLVEMIIDNRCTLAVFVKRFTRQYQFFTQFGSWIHLHSKRSIWYRAPSFVDPSEIDPIRPYLPSVEVHPQLVGYLQSAASITPQQPGQFLIAKIANFIRQADSLYRDHAGEIDQAYDKVAYDKQYRWMHINDITRDVLSLDSSDGIPASTIWAVHRTLILHDMGFVPEPMNHWKSGIFEILAKQDMDLVRQIRHWVREHQDFAISQACGATIDARKKSPKTSVLAEFAKDIMPIIKENRLARPRSESGDLGPSTFQIKPEPVAFRSIPLRAAKPSETLIFRFLEMWCARKATRQGSPLWALGPMILRSTGVYKDEDLLDLNTLMGYRFLQEVGVLTPWESKVAFDTRLALPGLNFDPRTENLLTLASKRAENFTNVDTMSDLRQDWGELEVFCIDDAGTQEVDDGFSLEPIAGEPSCYWVHVHTANPSAYLGPDDAVAKYAEHITQSLYYPDKTYNMISPKIAREHFSLEANRPVLTFSAKLSFQGDIIETRVTPSRIHNVIFVSPEVTSNHLSPGAHGLPTANYTVGKNPAPAHTDHSQRLKSSLTPGQVETLRTLSQLGIARRKSCVSSVDEEPHLRVLKYINSRPILESLPHPSVYYSQVEFPWRRVLRKIEGDPTIQLRARMFQPSVLLEAEAIEEARQGPRLVHDMMVLAGEIGASWCAARGVPLIFRGTARVDWQSTPEVSRRWQEACLPGQKGEALFLAADDYARVGRRAVNSSSPLKHEVLGTTAYAKVTSPIRRFTDMVAHWQIQAVLRSEAKLGRPLTEMDFPNLPFSKSRIESLTDRIQTREAILMRSMRDSTLHWCNLFVMRGYQFQDLVQPHALPEYLEGFIITKTLNYWLGKVKELNLAFQILIAGTDNPNVKHIEVGDWWKVKIEDASPQLQRMRVQPVELISRL